MTPSFDVPAQYFYALTANLPIEIGTDIRYQAAVSADPTQVVDNLHAAIDAGVIASALPITPEQAARRLAALGSAGGTAPVCNLGTGAALVTPWLAYANPAPTDDPVADIAPFWNSVLAPLTQHALTNPDLAGGHLQLVMSAIVNADATQLLIDMQSSAGVAALGITVHSVKDLDPTAFGGAGGITLAGWTSFFTIFPQRHPGVRQGRYQHHLGAARAERTDCSVRASAGPVLRPPARHVAGDHTPRRLSRCSTSRNLGGT